MDFPGVLTRPNELPLSPLLAPSQFTTTSLTPSSSSTLVTTSKPANPSHSFSSSSSSSRLLTLPLDVLRKILLNLEVRDILNLGATSSHFKALLLDDKTYVWRLLAIRDLHVSDPAPYPTFWHLFVFGVAPFHWIKTDFWIDDQTPFGEVYVSKYDKKSGTLCLYKLLSRKIEDTQEQNNENHRQQQQQRPPELVSSSVFLASMANQQRASNPNARLQQETRVPPKPQQLTSNPKIMLFPNQVDIVTYGPYIKLSQYTERNEVSGAWKWHSWAEVNTGAQIGLMRATALATDRLSKSMSVWPPFNIPAKDRTRNESRNNFLGHYMPPAGVVEHSNRMRGFTAAVSFSHQNTPSPSITTTSSNGTNSVTPQQQHEQTSPPRPPHSDESDRGHTPLTASTVAPTATDNSRSLTTWPAATHHNGGVNAYFFDYGNVSSNSNSTTATSIYNVSRDLSRHSTLSSSQQNTTASNRPPTPPSPNLFRLQRMTLMETLYGPVETVYRLNQTLYAPTKDCPFRGIWISGKSSEFHLFAQPNENTLEAIKLTGSAHLKRGEYTFLVNDLNNTLPSPYPEWAYARVVSGKGQVADFNSTNPRFIPIELVIISPSQIICYWPKYTFMDVYTRVNTNEILYGS